MELTDLREASVKDLRSFIAERGFSYAGLLERHELEARAEEAAAATQGGAAEEAVAASQQRRLTAEGVTVTGSEADGQDSDDNDSEAEEVDGSVARAKRLVRQEITSVISERLF